MFNSVLICLFALIALFLVLAVILVLRYISYRETRLLAEKGLARPEGPANGTHILRWGIGLATAGLVVCLVLYPLGRMYSSGYLLGFGPWMLLGLLPLFFGLALVLIAVLTRKE